MTRVTTEGPISGGNGQATAAVPPLPLTYREDEFFFAGEALRYAAPGGTMPYRSRMIVRRPVDPTAFSGVVLVEWLNVSAGFDGAPVWGYAQDEIVREGHVWVGVSAQQVGVAGGEAAIEGAIDIAGIVAGGLVGTDPARYGRLTHPGDAYCFGIFTQAGHALREADGPAPLGELAPVHVIGAGESQSGTFLATYLNEVHLLAPVYDGFLVHSRLGSAPSLDGRGLGFDGPPVTLRDDLGVPVLQFATETDLTLLQFARARQPDSDLLRTWEVAGTAHADKYLLCQAIGDADIEPADLFDAKVPVNDGMHHQTLKAALHHLVEWVRHGTPPPHGEPIAVHIEGDDIRIERDERGNAIGGIRTPSVDVPIATLSGEPAPGSTALTALFGSTVRYDNATLRAMYGSDANYREAFAKSLERAVDGGFVLAPEATAMLTAAHVDITD